MTRKELIEKLLEDEDTSDSSEVMIGIDGFSFPIDEVWTFNSKRIDISTRARFPENRYRFTFAMFDPKTGNFRGTTHRTYCEIDDETIIKDKDSYIPGWEDTKYVIVSIDREVDGENDVYKEIWRD